MEEFLPNVGKAIICFQYVERIKSELIIAAGLLGELGELRGEELAGAEKLMSSLLEALLGEIRIAHNVLGMRNFKKAGMQVEEAAGNVRLHEHSRAIECISRAISFITTSGQHAMQTLRARGLL